MKKIGFFIALAAMVALVSCDDDDDVDYTYKNGDYKAQMDGFSHGWQEFMEVTIKNDEVTMVNYDAESEEDGTLKSSLTEYPMPDPPGLPSTWYPELEAQYEAVDLNDYEPVDGITGATSTSGKAEIQFEAIMEAAKEGDTSTQVVPYPEG